MSSLWAAASAESWARIRWISFFSLPCSSMSSLLAWTTPMGSTKTVAPEEEMSWMRPGMSALHSAFTGTTKRPSRWVMRLSCRILL